MAEGVQSGVSFLKEASLGNWKWTTFFFNKEVEVVKHKPKNAYKQKIKKRKEVIKQFFADEYSMRDSKLNKEVFKLQDLAASTKRDKKVLEDKFKEIERKMNDTQIKISSKTERPSIKVQFVKEETIEPKKLNKHFMKHISKRSSVGDFKKFNKMKSSFTGSSRDIDESNDVASPKYKSRRNSKFSVNSSKFSHR